MRAGLAARLASLLVVAASLARADTPTLSAGATHTCAIDASGAAHCWGENARGQIDVPTASDAAGTPITGWRAVAASKGGCHSCGVTDAGALLCWGCDDDGELGPPPEVVGGWVAVAAGKGFTCGVDAVARAARCWGRFLPRVPVGGAWDGPWASVSAGEDFVCAVARDAGDASPGGGVAECKGWGLFGQTEVPTRKNASASESVIRWRSLSAGFQHACGVDALGAARCWGSDLFGESGLVPVVDAEGATLATVADVVAEAEAENRPLTAAEKAVLRHAATLRAFPETARSVAGEGSSDPRDARANAWGSVTAGKHWSCGVFGPGRRLACWGKKRAYAVGGAVADAYEEFGVVSFPRSTEAACARFLVVAAGTNHACAVTDERAHGENLYNGTDGTDDTALAASGDEVHRGGRMVCWGDASSGKTSPPKFVTAWRAWPTSAESADLGAAFAPSAFAATASDAVCGASVSGSAATATRAIARRNVACVILFAFACVLS